MRSSSRRNELRSASRLSPPSSSATSISAFDVTGHARPSRATETFLRSTCHAPSLSRHSPSRAMRSKREPAVPRTAGSSTSMSASFTSPPTRCVRRHSRSTATSPLPACGTTRESGRKRPTDDRSTSSADAETCQSPVNVTPCARLAASASPSSPCAVTVIRLASSRGARACASRRSAPPSRRMLASTFSKLHAMLRLASRYSTRLSRTSTSMSGGTSKRNSSPRAPDVGAPCMRYAPSAAFTSVSSVPSSVRRSMPMSRLATSTAIRRNGPTPMLAVRALMKGCAPAAAATLASRNVSSGPRQPQRASRSAKLSSRPSSRLTQACRSWR